MSKKYIVVDTQEIHRNRYVVTAEVDKLHSGQLQKLIDEGSLAEATFDILPEKIVSTLVYDSEEIFLSYHSNETLLIECINNVDELLEPDDTPEIPF